MKWIWVPVVLLGLSACSQVAPNLSDTELAPMIFGSSETDISFDLAKHSSGVYVVGETYGDLHAPPAGARDAFIRKYDAFGGVSWGKQFGTPQSDSAYGVASDSSNNAYVVGYTNGSLASTRGGADSFLRKYTASGAVSWTRQFGTSGAEEAHDVAVIGSTVYVAGLTRSATSSDYNAYLAKFNTSGTPLWTRTFGTPSEDFAKAVAVDSSGNAYVVGYTNGALTGSNGGGRDMFVRKYNTSGGVVWTKQFHYSLDDVAEGVAVNGTSVFVVGHYYFNAAASTDLDARLIKLTTSGGLVYSKRYVSSLDQDAFDVSVVNGAVFVSGGEIDSGGDIGGFVPRYDGSGNLLWRANQDSTELDYAFSVLARSSSEVYVTGTTDGVLGSSNSGRRDPFLRRLNGTNGSTVWTDQ